MSFAIPTQFAAFHHGQASGGVVYQALKKCLHWSSPLGALLYSYVDVGYISASQASSITDGLIDDSHAQRVERLKPTGPHAEPACVPQLHSQLHSQR